MLKHVLRMGSLFLVLLMMLGIYTFFKPSLLEPVAWEASENMGYQGPFDGKQQFQLEQTLSVGGTGPEAIASDSTGRLYTGLANGDLMRAERIGAPFERVGNTQGRPLGLVVDHNDHLYIADAYRGLLRFEEGHGVSVLADSVDGQPIVYADDLTVSQSGVVYFTDASTKFGAREYGGTFAASVLDLVEHGGHGRLLRYDPNASKVTVLIDGLQFANGLAIDPDERFLVLVETGNYRVLKYWLQGERSGEVEVLLENLPGFPDNVTQGIEGRFWVAFPSPRNPLMDSLAPYPALRKWVMNLPKLLHPKPIHYNHIVAIDENGDVQANLHNEDGVVPVNSSVLETSCCLLLGSLETDFIGVVPKNSQTFVRR